MRLFQHRLDPPHALPHRFFICDLDASHSGISDEYEIYATIQLMTQFKKVLIRILRGTSDANISFTDLQSLLIELGFEERVR